MAFGAPKAPPAGDGSDILNMTSYFRWHTSMNPPMADDNGKLTLIKPAYNVGIELSCSGSTNLMPMAKAIDAAIKACVDA